MMKCLVNSFIAFVQDFSHKDKALHVVLGEESSTCFKNTNLLWDSKALCFSSLTFDHSRQSLVEMMLTSPLKEASTNRKQNPKFF
jgi:hypothetical protein